MVIVSQDPEDYPDDASYNQALADGPVVWLDRAELSGHDRLTIDAYLDAVEYLLNPDDHPDRISPFGIFDFEGSKVGGYPLETTSYTLYQLAHSGEIDNVGESHSL
jgi:hypothetical protein